MGTRGASVKHPGILVLFRGWEIQAVFRVG